LFPVPCLALLVLSGGCLLTVLACRPDPYDLALRMIEPGEPVELSGGRTLTAERREGSTLRGVRIEGPAPTCDGTMEVEARAARLERVPGEASAEDGERVRLVLDEAVMVERCGELESVTRLDRLAVTLEGI
jgi:hypothetical protein